MGLVATFDVDTVADEGLCGALDETVFAAAQAEGRVLVTQDLDFSDMRRFLPGTHAGIILLRLRNPSRARLSERLLQLFQHRDVELWGGCFVVVTDFKLRVHWPQK